MVSVLSREGNPLMPCTKAKARRLLKENKAIIKHYEPFQIQLNFECENQVQKVFLGLDPGNTAGIAVITEGGRELFKGEVKLREDISVNLGVKKMMRRGRRNRKKYRKARFLNRGKRKFQLNAGVMGEFDNDERLPHVLNLISLSYSKEGDLLEDLRSIGIRQNEWIKKIKPYIVETGSKRHPAIHSFIQAHRNMVMKLKSFFPISDIVCEVAKFDTQKMINPSIDGEEYQNGKMKGYDDIREYVFNRDNWTCHYKDIRPDIKCCKKLNVEHMNPRNPKNKKDKKGTWNPSNLVCSCKTHNDLKGNMPYKEFTGKPIPTLDSFRETAYMNNIKNKLIPELNKIAPTRIIYGWKTRRRRKEFNLEKGHANDAISIAGIMPQIPINEAYNIIQSRKKKRSLHKANAERYICVKITKDTIKNTSNPLEVEKKLTLKTLTIGARVLNKIHKKIDKKTVKILKKLDNRGFTWNELEKILTTEGISRKDIDLIFKASSKTNNTFLNKSTSRRILNKFLKFSDITEKDKQIIRNNLEITYRRKDKRPNINQERGKQNTTYIENKKGKWCLNDKVLYNGRKLFISGFGGSNVYLKEVKRQVAKYKNKKKETIEKEVLSLIPYPEKKNYSTSNIKLISRNNNWLWQKEILNKRIILPLQPQKGQMILF